MKSILVFVCIVACFLGIVGCDDDSVGHERIEHRLKITDNFYQDQWHWKILRDSETGKEWVVIHDSTRMVVVPFDGGDVYFGNNR